MLRSRAYPTLAVLALAIALAGTAHASPDRYVGKLAENVSDGRAEQGCVVLPKVDLCGWRVRLLPQAVQLQAGVSDCERGVCAYELAGRTAREPFFCNGTVAWYPRRHRWIADQALDCYGDRDPSWGVTEDDVLFREP